MDLLIVDLEKSRDMYVEIATIVKIIVLFLGIAGPFNRKIRTYVLQNTEGTLLHDFYDEVQDYIDGNTYTEIEELLLSYLIYLVCLAVISVGIAILWPLAVVILGVGELSGLALRLIKNKTNKNKQNQ